MNKIDFLACLIGIIVGAGATWFVLPDISTHTHTDKHPIANPSDDEYHVHADFHIVINDEMVDLSSPEYMTTATQEFHSDAHLHDGEGDVLHIHAPGVTFVEFLESLNVVVTNDCITYSDTEYCTSNENSVALYIENELYEGNIADYIPADDERILLYYGSMNNENIASYLDAVPDDACIFSGTCPERGTAPPESCGLTCEL